MIEENVADSPPVADGRADARKTVENVVTAAAACAVGAIAVAAYLGAAWAGAVGACAISLMGALASYYLLRYS